MSMLGDDPATPVLMQSVHAVLASRHDRRCLRRHHRMQAVLVIQCRHLARLSDVRVVHNTNVACRHTVNRGASPPDTAGEFNVRP